MSGLGRSSIIIRPAVAALIVWALSAVAPSALAGKASAGARDLAGPLRQRAAGWHHGGQTSAGSDLAQVEVLFRSEEEAIATDIARYGARIEYRRDRRVQALVPVSCLADIAALPQVAQVSPPAQLIACQGFGAVWSEALQLTSAASLHAAGYTGRGARIAIIDTGFADLDAAEVPVDPDDPTQVISLRTDGSTTASSHGTAVAETVADMAPDASLTLYAVDTPMSIESAIDMVIAGGYQIAVMGVVVVDGPFDGTHPLVRAVNSAANAGVLWIQPAGNFATRHWAGMYTDADGDNICELARGTEDINLSLRTGRFDAYLSWYETAGPQTAQDYDLVLRDAAGGLVAQSSFGQNGDDPPREHLTAYITTAGTYRLQIVRYSSDLTKRDRFQLFIPDYDLPTALQVPESSLATPAEASGAFTIGATRGTSVDSTPYGVTNVAIDVIEPFSSRGPTLTGGLKPDMVAPDACRTSLADPGAAPVRAGWEYVAPNAFGTSFAAAHVAGAAALLWSEDRSRTRSELISALLNLAVAVPPPLPPREPLPNNTYGHGRLNLRTGTDVTAPQARFTYPRNGETITTMQPVITALLEDQGGSGIDPSTIVMTLDGVELTGFVYDTETGVVTYRVGPPNHPPLSRTNHRVTLRVSDRAGNRSALASSSFRVSPPTISAGLHMISIPYADMTDLRPSSLFGIPPEQVIVVRWLPTDTTPVNKYHWWGGPRGEDQYASFEPLDTKEPPFVVSDPPAGLGYFVYLSSDAILNPTGRSLADQTTYTIRLSVGYSHPKGWNMIGCPFPNAVTWGGVQFVTDGVRQDLPDAVKSGVTEGILFELKRSGGSPYYDFPSDPLGGTLEPWKGYWVHVLKDTTLVLYNSVVASSTAPTTGASPNRSVSSGWVLKLGAAVAGGCDPSNYIGIAQGASDGRDSADVPEPPALSVPVRVYLARNDWGEFSGQYAKDVRGALGTGQEWDVTVECVPADADVTVSWSDLNTSVPPDVSLILTDMENGRQVYMRTATGYTYRTTTANSKRHLRITAAPRGQGNLVLSNVTTAAALDGTVSVSYVVNQAAEVTVEIRNISGVRVRNLGPQLSEPGTVQTVYWNRRNDKGTRVPNGRYVVKVTARTDSGQVAQMVRTMTLGR